MAIALMKMFWKSMYVPSKINTILEKQDANLEEILAEDDVVEECRSCNSKLLEFLTKNENLERLVDMMVSDPDPETEEKLKYKNAHLACEILTSDTTQITDALSERTDLLEKIYSFFDRDPPVNPLQASFFSKTMGLLITHKSEKMLAFFKSHDNFAERLVSHLDTSAIADLLLRLVTCIDSIECRNHCFQWLNEQRLIRHLVSLIDISQSTEVHSNASQSICDIVRLSREHQHQHNQHVDVGSNGVVAPDDVLLRAIESAEVVSQLMDRAFPQDVELTNESLITNTITILQTLLEPRKTSTTIFSIVEDTVLSNSTPDETLPEADATDSSDLEVVKNCKVIGDTNQIVMAIVARLQDFFRILFEPPKQRYNPMPSTLGQLSPPLGPSRLSVVRFFNALLSLKDASVEEKLAEIDVPSKVVSLFFEYPWNNFLHGEVEKFIFHSLNSISPSYPLLTKLLKECSLIDRVCQELEQNFKSKEKEEKESTSMSRRPGYLGHLTALANLFVNKFNSSPDLFQMLAPEMQSRWSEFVCETLEEINKINSNDLGVGIGSGHNQLTSSEDDDDDDDFQSLLPPQNDALQKAFNDYQVQQLSTNFVESFGFTEDDFNECDDLVGSPFMDRVSSLDFNLDSVEESPSAAATFRQACQGRIQQFDQSEEGEDESWQPFGLSELKQMTANHNGGEFRKSNQQRSSQKLGGEDDEDDEEEDDYANDSEDDLDSPAVIQQTKNVERIGDGPGVKLSLEEKFSKVSSSGENCVDSFNSTNNEDDDDDDYESLQDSKAALLDVSFVGDADDDREVEEEGGVRMNGTMERDDATSQSSEQVASRQNHLQRVDNIGSAVDAEEA